MLGNDQALLLTTKMTLPFPLLSLTHTGTYKHTPPQVHHVSNLAALGQETGP